MAPKPPAKGPATPQRPPTKLEQCLQSYNCATLGILLLFCLFLYTLWYISLCTIEKTKRDPIRYAVAQMRRYLVSRNPEYGDLNDTDLILQAENVSRELLIWAHKINELQTEIADLHYKLNHDWTAHKGFLYLFSYEIHDFYGTVTMCRGYKAYILDILSDDEETFIEQVTKDRHGDYWFGLTLLDNEWKWQVSRSRVLKSYWMHGQPDYSRDCARFKSGCKTKLKCWTTVTCSLTGRGICKKKPEDKWIN